jgi:transposase
MPKTRPPYSPEFRQQIVELVRSGRNPTELSREFGCSATSITNWVAQAMVDAGKPAPGGKDVLTSAERDELSRLRREVRRLKTERDILAKATAWFANKDDPSTPSSNS